MALPKAAWIALALLCVGCGGSPRTVETPSTRFEVVSRTEIELGVILVIRDTVTGGCMASHLYSGVMSWATPCTQEEFNEIVRQRQMVIEVPGLRARE